MIKTNDTINRRQKNIFIRGQLQKSNIYNNSFFESNMYQTNRNRSMVTWIRAIFAAFNPIHEIKLTIFQLATYMYYFFVLLAANELTRKKFQFLYYPKLLCRPINFKIRVCARNQNQAFSEKIRQISAVKNHRSLSGC